MNEHPAPQPPGRRNVRLVIGIVLTAFGGLAVLGQLSSRLSGTASMPEDTAEAAGYAIGSLLIVLIPLAVGIWLIVTSKRKD